MEGIENCQEKLKEEVEEKQESFNELSELKELLEEASAKDSIEYESEWKQTRSRGEHISASMQFRTMNYTVRRILAHEAWNSRTTRLLAEPGETERCRIEANLKYDL